MCRPLGRRGCCGSAESGIEPGCGCVRSAAASAPHGSAPKVAARLGRTERHCISGRVYARRHGTGSYLACWLARSSRPVSGASKGRTGVQTDGDQPAGSGPVGNAAGRDFRIVTRHLRSPLHRLRRAKAFRLRCASSDSSRCTTAADAGAGVEPAVSDLEGRRAIQAALPCGEVGRQSPPRRCGYPRRPPPPVTRGVALQSNRGHGASHPRAREQAGEW